MMNPFLLFDQEGSSTGFSWSNMLSMLMQMILGQTGGVTGPSKNEIDDGAPASPWTNLLSVGLRVLTALLGGPQQSVDGIDKVDNQSSPMQVCAVSQTLLRYTKHLVSPLLITVISASTHRFTWLFPKLRNPN